MKKLFLIVVTAIISVTCFGQNGEWNIQDMPEYDIPDSISTFDEGILPWFNKWAFNADSVLFMLNLDSAAAEALRDHYASKIMDWKSYKFGKEYFFMATGKSWQPIKENAFDYFYDSFIVNDSYTYEFYRADETLPYYQAPDWVDLNEADGYFITFKVLNVDGETINFLHIYTKRGFLSGSGVSNWP